MKDAGLWQPGSGDLRYPFPRHAILLTAPPERASPEVGDVVSERPKGPRIPGHRVVREEARDHTPQPSALCRNGVVHADT